MKKLLGMTIALAMIVPAGANAELLKNFKLSGNLDIQTTSARNVTDFVTRPTGVGASPAASPNNDRIGHATTRIILKMDWDLLDDVHSRVTLVKGASGGPGNGGTARTYGTPGAAGVVGAQSLNTAQDNTIIQEANVKIDKVFDALDLTAGRQFYGEEGDLVAFYGPKDNFGLNVSAIDMFRADWNGEHMSITGIAGKESNPVANDVTGGAAVDLRGVVLSCKMHEMVKPSLYVYNKVTHGVPAGLVAGKNTNLWVAGLKAKLTSGGLTASIEAAKNFGEDRATDPTSNFKGWALLLKTAYKLDLSDVGMITPWGEIGKGSGDNNGSYAGNGNFQAIATDYRPGAIYGRFDNTSSQVLGNGLATFDGSSNGLSNRVIWGLGVKVTPSAVNKLTVGAQFYHYEFARMADNGSTPTNPVLASRNSRNIGTETDVTAEWKHSENVSLKATAGSFMPGAYVKDLRGPNAALNPVVMLAGDVAIKF